MAQANSSSASIPHLCAGCHKKLPKREYLACAYCTEAYDLDCANVTSKRFYNTMTSEHKEQWKCPACYCKTPRTGNLDTPIRSSNSEQQVIYKSPEISHVTHRKNVTSQNNDTLGSEDLSLSGDTICPGLVEPGHQTELTLQSVSDVINRSLQENNKNIIAQLQTTIQTEVRKAIQLLKEEFKQDIHILNEQNKSRISEIKQLNEKIDKLKNDINLLENEMHSLKTKKPLISSDTGNSENVCKKFVLFGLDEYFRESECDLYGRLHEIFRDLMQVDLSGYVEDTYRIGRYSKSGYRPLVVELISKRMVKYLIENRHYLHNTGLSISEFLDRPSRLKRKAMREQMLMARKNGLHAVLRNNQLYIDGKQICIDDSESSLTIEVVNLRGSEEKERLSLETSQPITHGRDYSFRKIQTIQRGSKEKERSEPEKRQQSTNGSDNSFRKT